jgi:hypothetical protein
MASIISQTFADGDNQAIRLENEGMGRQFAIGSDWTRIRIGIHCNIVPNGTSNLVNTWLSIHCSTAATDHFGTQAMVLGMGCKFGVGAVGYSGGTWTYNAAAGNPYYGCFVFDEKVVNTVETGSGTGGVVSGSCVPTNAGTVSRRGVLAIDLTKTGSALKVTGHIMSSTANGSNGTLLDFRQFMANALDVNAGGALPTYLGQQTKKAFSYNHTTYATDAGTYGELDSITVGYSESLLSQLNIFALEVYRHA